MFTFTIQETIAELSSTTTTAKRLTVTSWNGDPAKLDLRTWRYDSGEVKPGRGVTLTDDEAMTLLNALEDYFDGRGTETPQGASYNG